MEMPPKKVRPGAWLFGEVLTPRLAPVQQSTQVHPEVPFTPVGH